MVDIIRGVSIVLENIPELVYFENVLQKSVKEMKLFVKWFCMFVSLSVDGVLFVIQGYTHSAVENVP